MHNLDGQTDNRASTPPAGDEPDLITKAQSGDEVALNELLLIYWTPLRKHVAHTIPRQIQGVVDADDILQQTYLQAMQHIGQFSPQGVHSFYGWLKTIATNCAQDTFRRLKSAKRGGNRRQPVAVPAAVPGRVVGVDRTETRQPRQLPTPGGAAAHQPVDQDQRSTGTAAVGQRCGVHRLILPVT